MDRLIFRIKEKVKSFFFLFITYDIFFFFFIDIYHIVK